MNIGDKIRNARLQKGLTQEALGELLGVQKSAIAKYESGRVVNIKRSTLKKISDVLGIRPAELITDIETKPVELAELHADMLQDEDMVEIYTYLKNLNAKKRAIVKELARSLAED
jgi:transcriptional regulator with XRE-family HTH domain